MSAMKMQLNMSMKQELKMTLQLQQAIKLLQLSKMELIDQIQREMVDNPALEELTPEEEEKKEREEQEEASVLEMDQAMAAFEAQKESQKKEEVQATQEVEIKEDNWEAYLEYYQRSDPIPEMSYKDMQQEELPGLEATLSTTTTLFKHLMEQVQYSHLDEEQRRCAALIIGNLNDDGFLVDISLEEIAEQSDVDMETAEYTLEFIQALDPVGVATRDFREALQVQAEVYHPDEPYLIDMIQDHIHHLERKNYEAIAVDLEMSLEEVKRAAKLISQMDPRPGRRFIHTEPHYIIPDIYVYKRGDDYVVELNEDGLPKLKVSPRYLEMVERKANAKQEVATYVQKKVSDAKWLIRSIYQRQSTIRKVTQEIVKKQREFLDKGIAYLKPMVLRDIAMATGLHESTISRVTNKKYVYTPQGTFELKYFFNSRISRIGGKGEDLASEAVKNKIRQIIAKEDPTKPYSDQKIVDILKKDNIKIARRTVAKYREALGILSSTQRKKIL